MRIIFENLHCNCFLLNPFWYCITRRPQGKKHENLLKYLVDHNYKIYIYITPKGTSIPKRWKILEASKMWKKIECLLTCKLNHIPLKSVRIIDDLKFMKPEDIYICYLFYTENRGELLKQISSYKVMDLNHLYAYIPQTKYLSDSDCLVAESNIFSHSDLVKSIKEFDAKDYVHIIKPYTFQERFCNNKSFAQRKNKAVATGTWRLLQREKRFNLFREVYHSNYLFPMRREIYIHKEELKQYIDSVITKFPDDDMVDDKSKFRIVNWMRKQKEKYVINNRMQTKYRSFDMPSLYNDYKMAVVPEDMTGFPAIGFVESMASGCAFIGKECWIYDELGMQSGIHYIGYDGTLKNLAEKIAYYQIHQEELEKIARTGCQYVHENFNGNKVAEDFYKQIIQLSRKRTREKKNG